MADSVGKGIALGERFKYDTTSGTAAFNNALNKRYNENAAAEKNVVDALDFKIDYKEWLPVYGKAAAKKQAELYNKYLTYKSENKATALNRIQTDLYNAKQELGRLKGDNDRAKTYVTQKEGLFRNAALVNALTSTETNHLSDISKYNDGYFINVGANGEFAFRPVQEMQPATLVKYEDGDYDKVRGKTKQSAVPGKMDVEYVEVLKPAAVKRNAEALALNPQFRDNVLIANPNLLKLSPQEQVKATYDAAFEIATKMQRPNRSEWKMADLPNASGSGSDKDKRKKPVVVKDTKQTLQLPTGKTKKVTKMDILSGKSITKEEPEMYNEESNIDLSVSVAGAPPITIPLDERVIDARTNKFIKGSDLNQSVTFRPDNVQTEVIKKTGKREVYVLGEAKVNVVDEDSGTSTEKIINYKVPYDKVSSTIEGKFDLSDFFADFNKLPQPKIKEGPQPATKPTKGKLY